MKSLNDAIDESGLKMTWIAKQTQITEWRLSRIANGHLEATDTEKLALSVVLRRPVAELFEVAA